MTQEEYDALYVCEWGFWHVVPSLAAECSGVTHGLGDQQPPRIAAA